MTNTTAPVSPRRQVHCNRAPATSPIGLPAVGLLAALLCAAWPGGASGGPINELVVFSTSLADNGNYAALYGNLPAPYDPVRFTNGPIWVETLAQLIGIPVPTPSLLGGTNYAYAAAATGWGPPVEPGLLNIGQQVDDYLDDNVPTGSELFVIGGGQNNFSFGETNAAVPVQHVLDHITALANAGGQNFMIATLMPLGQRPDNRGGPNEAFFDQLCLDFNSQLLVGLDALRTSLSLNIFVADANAVWQSANNDPGTYGLTNVDDPALDYPLVVPNPDEYFWWDEVHPTRAIHSALAHAAYDAIPESFLVAVPEPSTLGLALAGLAVLSRTVLRRRKA